MFLFHHCFITQLFERIRQVQTSIMILFSMLADVYINRVFSEKLEEEQWKDVVKLTLQLLTTMKSERRMWTLQLLNPTPHPTKG